MRGWGPATATAGVLALSWTAWELWRFLWLRELSAGVQGVYVFDWTGPAVGSWPDGGVGTLVVLPVLIGLALTGLAAASGFRGAALLERAGPVLLGLGALAGVAWATLASVIGLSTAWDGWLRLPLFAVAAGEPYGWEPWSRWLLDAGALLAVAALLGVGPATPIARRALWVALLAVGADSVWRVAVTVLSGQVPGIAVGLGVLGWGQLVVWLLLGGLAIGFVALFANVPDRDGPRPVAVLAGLGIAGAWLGLQAAALWSAGLLDAMGREPVLLWRLPEYDGLLGWLRVVLVLVGTASLGLAAWRSGPDPEGA